AGRYVQGDRPKRDAIDPFTPRMMAVATKTAGETSGFGGGGGPKNAQKTQLGKQQQTTTKKPPVHKRNKQIEGSGATAMMSTITAPRHGARRLGPVIPIVMAEMIAEAGASLCSSGVQLCRTID